MNHNFERLYSQLVFLKFRLVCHCLFLFLEMKNKSLDG